MNLNYRGLNYNLNSTYANSVDTGIMAQFLGRKYAVRHWLLMEDSQNVSGRHSHNNAGSQPQGASGGQAGGGSGNRSQNSSNGKLRRGGGGKLSSSITLRFRGVAYTI